SSDSLHHPAHSQPGFSLPGNSLPGRVTRMPTVMAFILPASCLGNLGKVSYWSTLSAGYAGNFLFTISYLQEFIHSRPPTSREGMPRMNVKRNFSFFFGPVRTSGAAHEKHLESKWLK